MIIDILLGLGPEAGFGLMSAMLSAIAFVPYIADTLRGKTKPQRASWLIWSVLGSIALMSQIVEGATHSLWFAGIQVGGTVAVFLLAITRGVGGFLNKRDRFVLLMAAGGLGAWALTENSVYALAISISVSLLGGSVTVAKAYAAPDTETPSSWALCFVASICALFAVGSLDGVLMAYPAYLLVLNGAVCLAIFAGRWRGRQAAPSQITPIPV